MSTASSQETDIDFLKSNITPFKKIKLSKGKAIILSPMSGCEL